MRELTQSVKEQIKAFAENELKNGDPNATIKKEELDAYIELLQDLYKQELFNI